MNTDTGRTDCSVEPIFRLGRRQVSVLLLLLGAIIGVLAHWHHAKFLERPVPLVDFDVFHIVGQMAWLGNLEDAYQFRLFRAQQQALAGGHEFMPWTYPPTFDLVMAPLGLVPLWLAYALFTSLTLAAYLLVLRRIAGGHFAVALTTLLGILVITIMCGQNGFLTGSLVGLFVLLHLRGSKWAGVPLGLMVIKPHLAIGLGIYLLLARRWMILAQAAAVAAGVAGLATLVFGLDIWSAFLHGVAESKGFLERGRYPLFRMTSIYAGLRAFGLDPRVALALHLGVALCVLTTVHLAIVRGWRPERTLATAVMATVMVSPYNYDYDAPIFGIALALALPTLAGTSSRRLFGWILGPALFIGIYPIVVMKAAGFHLVKDLLFTGRHPLALPSFMFAAMITVVLVALWKAERIGAAGDLRRVLSRRAFAPGPAVPAFGSDGASFGP